MMVPVMRSRKAKKKDMANSLLETPGAWNEVFPNPHISNYVPHQFLKLDSPIYIFLI
jgi:hypothetical protein